KHDHFPHSKWYSPDQAKQNSHDQSRGITYSPPQIRPSNKTLRRHTLIRFSPRAIQSVPASRAYAARKQLAIAPSPESVRERVGRRGLDSSHPALSPYFLSIESLDYFLFKESRTTL